MRPLVACLAAAQLAFAAPVLAQDPAPPASVWRLPEGEALRVFLDCQVFCDFDYVRTEIVFVNWVRDRRDAQVHILVTTQVTGSGGREYTLKFIGLERYAGVEQTLRYVSEQTSTADEIRAGLARVIKLGLVPYVAPLAEGARLDVRYTPPAGPKGEIVGAAKDPWNLWYFRTRVGGSFSGERLTGSRSLSLSFSANRTTEAWKINFAANASYRESRFELSDGTLFRSIRRDFNVTGLEVKSVGSRWAVGLKHTVSSSTFVNQDRYVRIAPGIEVDVFPYRDSTRRLLTIQYTSGLAAFDYREVTIFGKTADQFFDETVIVSLNFRQPWGSLSSSFEASHYFQDPSKYRVTLFGGADVRLARGLSVNVFGDISRIHDQVYLPRGAATDEEILVRQRQLATSYSYFVNFGVSYAFGSRYQNVVNPRFGGSSGGTIVIF